MMCVQMHFLFMPLPPLIIIIISCATIISRCDIWKGIIYTTYIKRFPFKPCFIELKPEVINY